MTELKIRANTGFRKAGRHAQMMPALASIRVHVERGTKAPKNTNQERFHCRLISYLQVMSALFASDAFTATILRMLVMVTLDE